MEQRTPLSYEDFAGRLGELCGHDGPPPPETRIREDLGLDSLGFAELADALEAVAGREVEDGRVTALVTVGDAYRLYQQLLP